MCEISLFVTAANQEGILLATYAILGDPGAVSRVGRKGGTKVFKVKDTTTADSHQNVAWKREFIFFSVSIVIIPTRLPCQMQANSSGAEFLSTVSNFMKRMTVSRAVDGEKCTNLAYLTFSSPAHLKLPIYLRDIVIRQKQNILGANSIAPVDSIPNVFSTHR